MPSSATNWGDYCGESANSHPEQKDARRCGTDCGEFVHAAVDTAFEKPEDEPIATTSGASAAGSLSPPSRTPILVVRCLLGRAPPRRPPQPFKIGARQARQAGGDFQERTALDRARRNVGRKQLGRIDLKRGGDPLDDWEPCSRCAGLDLCDHVHANVGGFGESLLGQAALSPVGSDQKTKAPAQIGHAHLRPSL
jgi:hypothetical protein